MHEAMWTRADAVAWLDAPERVRSEDPRALWRRAGLAPGMTVVDVGAGSGYFALPAAEIVGPTGRVFAVDVSPELVGLVRDRIRERGLTNAVALRSTAKKIPLPSGRADRVLMANLLHGLPSSTVAEAARLVRPGGRLLNEDWAKRPTEGGPPVEHRLTPTEASQVLERYGLRRVGSAAFGPSHYLVTMERPLRRPPGGR